MHHSPCHDVPAAQSDAEFEAEMRRREAAIRRACEADTQLDGRERLLNRARMLSEAYGENPMTGEPYYTTADVLAWVEHAVAAGCTPPRLGPKAIIDALRLRQIPTAPFRERFLALYEEGAVTAKGLAKRLGLTREQRGEAMGDATRLRRVLGIIPSPSGPGEPTMRTFIPYDLAVALADALDLPYYEVGV